MAWEKLYQLIGWKNKNEMLTTPLGATLLNRMDNALNEIDNRVIELNKQKAAAGDLDNMITNVSYNKETGVITFTKYSGSVQSFDLSEYISNIEVLVNRASASATTASQKASEASASATSASKSAVSAKEDAERAEVAAKNAEAVSGVGIATETIAGLMAGGDNAVSEDGTLLLTKTTTDRTLLKSHAGGLKVNSVDGESQQKQYSGKNKLNNALTSQTASGITITLNEDKSSKFSGTTTSAKAFWFARNLELEAGEYIYSVDSNGTVAGGVAIVETETSPTSELARFTLSSAKAKSFTLSEKTVIRANVYYASGSAINATFYPMIRLASVADDTYEPFVGNQSSPNPDYPQDIKSVEISEIKSVGKNLLKNTAITTTSNGITFTVNDDGSVTVNGTATAQATLLFTHEIDFPKIGIGKYIYAGNYSAGKVVTAVDRYIDGKWKEAMGINGAEFEITDDNVEHVYYAYIRVSSGNTVNNVTVYPMIRKADISDDTYEPYTESTITLSAPVTLRGIGDVKDSIVKQDGVYGVLRKRTRYVINGTEPWVKNDASSASNYLYYAYASITRSDANSNLLCDKMIATTSAPISNNGISMPQKGNLIYLNLGKDIMTTNTAEFLKQYLTSNNFEIEYSIETPTFEPLPLADQIALHQLETFDTVTYISTDSTIEPVIEVEYGTSKVGAYAIKGMNTAEANALKVEQLNTLTNELSAQLI